MRPTLLALSLAFALAPVAAVDKPGVDAFFDAMAIEAAPGQQARFVAGDNLAGYFEGFTHSVDAGAGYVLKSGTVFHNYVSHVDGVRNERADGREQVLPFGHRVAYANGSSEELALLSKQHALALRVTSTQPSLLGLQPLLKTAGAISFNDGVVLVAPGKGATQFMALAGDRPFTLEDKLLLRASAPAASFTVVVAFGATAEQASKRASTLAAGDPIGAERRANPFLQGIRL